MQSTHHPQDDLLIVGVLTQLGENLDGTSAVQAARTRRLARDITAEHGLNVGDALFQIDYGFGGQRCSADQDQRVGCTSGESASK